MQVYFKNSKGASFLSIIGCMTGIGAIIAFIDTQDFQYFLLAACGFAFLYLGNLRGNQADFNQWLADRNQKDIEEKISASISFAIEKYQECPNKYTYEYIRRLNPEAGTYIKKDRDESRMNSLLHGKKNK